MTKHLERNKDTVRAHFEALNSGDYSTLPSVHAETGRNHAQRAFDISEWPPEGVPFGPVEVQGTFEWLRAAFEDLQVEVEDLVAEGDQVVAWIRMQGIQRTADGPVPAGSGRVDFRHAHRFRVSDGRIVEHWAVRDDLRAMLQAGVVTPPSR